MSPSLMITAAHVVTDTTTINVQVAGSAVRADVLGLNEGLDVALIRLSAPVDGHVFSLARALPAVGTDVAAMGFPLGSGFTFTKGSISAVDRQERSDAGVKSHLIQTDTAINFGNSGGPLVTVDGTAVGIVSLRSAAGVQNTNFAASIVTGWAVATMWRDRNEAVPAASCSARKALSAALPRVSVYASQPEASDLASTLFAHGDAINHANYTFAFSLLSANLRRVNGNPDTWSSGLKSSYWVALAVDSVVRSGPTLSADVRLRTVQLPEDGPDNQTCSDWTIRYGMVVEAGIWHIDSAKEPWGPPQPC